MNRLKLGFLTCTVAIILLLTSLVGATYAWFTDLESSDNNTVISGTLDANAYWMSGKEDPSQGAWTEFKSGAVFNYDKWEPGYVESKHIKITNEGNLPYRYKMILVANGEVSALADVIDVYQIEGATQISSRNDVASLVKIGTLSEIITDENGIASGIILPAGSTANEGEFVESRDFTIVLKMQEGAGNEYMNMSIGSTFSIKLFATQIDENAEYPSTAVAVSSLSDLAENVNAGKPIVLTSDISGYNTKITESAEVDLGGNTLTASTFTVQKSFSLSNGTFSASDKYIDIRPVEDSEYIFTDVKFVNTHKAKTSSNSGTNRVKQIVKLIPPVAGVTTTLVFKDCTFENAALYFNGLSGAQTNVNITFENCTFNALDGSSKLLEFQSYMNGEINIINCTFNIQGTCDNVHLISVKDSSSDYYTVNAINNTLIANKATPYTYNAELGETLVDNVQISYYGAKNYCLFDYRQMTQGYTVVNEEGTIIEGEIAIASRR